MKSSIIKLLYPGWRLYKFLVLNPLYKLKSTWFVWNLRNYEGRKLQKENPLSLDDFGMKVLENVKKDGIYISHINDAFPENTWFFELKNYAESLKARASQNEVKTYWIDMWDADNFTLDFSNPFLRFSLEPKMLAIANAYLGMYSRLHSISLSETILVAEGTHARHSQMWHRDGGNKKYFKIFIYLNDIGENDGPFIFVKGSHPGGKWYNTFPRLSPYSPRYKRIADAELSKIIPERDIIKCTGKAGTLVFADTVGLHKGGYSTKNPRLASITTYYSKGSLERSKHRDKFTYPPDFDVQIRSLSPQAVFAIEKRS